MTPAEELTKALHGRWHNDFGSAKCPAHEDSRPSLSIRDGESRVILKCHAGCDSDRVIRALKREGLWPIQGDSKAVASSKSKSKSKSKPDRIELALAIWKGRRDPHGTIAEKYLAGRGLTLPPDTNEVIGFLPACPFKGKRVPALLALFRDIVTDAPCGLHRTPLLPDGSDRDRELDRAMLGRSSGAAIKLSSNDEVTIGLHVAEGLESGLALMAFGLSPCWSLGSAGGIRQFPVLSGIEALTIAVDNDDAGITAGQECARRWVSDGREVRLIRAPTLGHDIADLAAEVA